MAGLRCLVQGTMILSLLLFLHTPSTSSVLHSWRSSGSCVASERAALVSFKASLSDPGNQLSSWQGEDCCNWKGVGCSNRSGHVVKLNLACRLLDCLQGEIGSSLVALQRLRYLDLSWNYLFNGSKMPEFVGTLKSLRHLNLSATGFGGRIPPRLGNLSNLVSLDINSKKFCCFYPYSDDLAWVSHLSSLKYLDMSGVNLTAAVDWTHAVNMLPSLRVLRLANSDLPSMPPSLRHGNNLTALEILDISHNTLHTKISPNWFWDVASLKYLDVSWCGFHGPLFPSEMRSMTSLEEISLAGNNLGLGGAAPSSLKNLCNLKGLDLSYLQITRNISELEEWLPRCSWTKLEWLDLSQNNFYSGLPNWILLLTNLTSIDLYNNTLTGYIPLWFAKLATLQLGFNYLHGAICQDHFKGLTRLKVLDLSGNSLALTVNSDWVPPFRLAVAELRSCRLGPTFPAWLRSQEGIHALDISNASITGAVPNWFWDLVTVTNYLDLSRNQLTGTLPSTLELMEAVVLDLSANRFSGPIPKFPRNVEYLDFSSNSLSGTLPLDFATQNLDVLALRNNSISGTIPTSLCTMSQISHLDLSENMLTGEVPTCSQQEVSNSVVYMASLKLNNNNLSGTFPPFLQLCPYLELLDFAYNQLSGTLPVWLGKMLPSLALLRLRSNMFTGHIPIDLTDIPKLQYLDLACNNFSGSIPESILRLSAMKFPKSDSSFWLMTADAFSMGSDDSISYTESTTVLTKGQQLEFSKEIIYMVNLDLSCNRFTGRIPSAISALIALKNVNFSWNTCPVVILLGQHQPNARSSSSSPVKAAAASSLSPREFPLAAPTSRCGAR